MSIIAKKIMMGSGPTAGGGNYFLASYSDTLSIRFDAIGVDSQGNIYPAGTTYNNAYASMSGSFLLLSVDADGNVSWAKQLGDTGGAGKELYWSFVRVSPDDGIFVGGQTNADNPGGNGQFMHVFARYAQDGTISFKKVHNISNGVMGAMCIDPAGSFVFTAGIRSSNQQHAHKSSASTGLETYGKQVEANQSTNNNVVGCDVDGSGRLHAVYPVRDSLGDFSAIAYSLTSSGTLHYNRFVGAAYGNGNTFPSDLRVRPDNKIFIPYRRFENGSDKVTIVEYDTDGTVLGQKYINTTREARSVNRLAFDADGNIYITATSANGDNSRVDVFKLNSTYTSVEWAFFLENSLNDMSAPSIAIDNENRAVLASFRETSNDGKFFRIPIDGSLTSGAEAEYSWGYEAISPMVSTTAFVNSANSVSIFESNFALNDYSDSAISERVSASNFSVINL